ncbi:type IV toxin-antitoxin system AbiEi family antitoxin domain-containing protein [Longimicrobium sp.]|uniref:type IV toxin-antitoxin system AbiEi family antitoxin domain-containing protein n=1 Tax=Longimicrobium sp. TaxID=2029185 RepID=UPI002B89EB9C|nr:type IV toxin-antitoxin system AbiEi family antitoxin domain-containing protein [Longimicrobium sp.]HSU13877.1 type IV toxin-antitoxin system AbiEi family antitoxin domain-containing protein [Longimicrobium sp.]
MPGSSYRSLQDLAADQHGYFTTAQARDWGVSTMALVMMARRNSAERVSHGVYRLVHYPSSPLGSYMEAALWPGRVRGVVSHESVLALHEVSDVSPAAVHITVPRRFRTHRRVPGRLVLHRTDLDAADLDTFEGIPVTTLERAIRDCSAAHLGPELVRQAIDEARRKGLLAEPAAGRLSAELLAE